MDVDDGFAEAIASRYRIERELGRGGMAIVYLAQDQKHRRPVALKVLRPEVATTLGAERFLREITIAARLVHPNILPLHDSGEAAGQLYYVMPYVGGATLRQRLDREKQLPLDDVVDITAQIAAALDYAHAQGVVHRDVKPDNVLLVGEQVLVADFGLARALTSAASTPLTRTGTVVGTPAYMSPEQCAPGEAVDSRSDVYALACMAFEMIAGVTPFRGATAQAMMAHQISGDPPSVCAERERCPRAVDQVLKRGLAKSPADRYQSAGELAKALAEAIGRGVAPRSADHAPPRRRAGRWMSASALVLVIATAGWLVSQRALGAKPALERSTYAVFPFRQAAPASRGGLDGAGAALLLHNAMARWRGVRLVDDMRIGDLWARRKPRTVDDALRAAEGLHAGQVAWGDVSVIGDSLLIDVVAYDVARGPGASREYAVRVGRDAFQLDSVFGALADSIIVGGTGVRGTSATGTHDLTALYQFLDGKKAVERFDFRAAEEHFSAAAESDESYAAAHLWLARMRAWRGEAEPSAWLGDATRAVALSSSLSERDAWHARALRALASGNAPQACGLYRALIRGDSADFAAWFGLGDCNARDDAVVRDPRSPTGFAFRGSYASAIEAYRHALALAPSFHEAERGMTFQRLAGRVLYTEESTLRRGVGIPPDTQRYAAFPSFSGDSVAFVPVPFRTAIQARDHPATEHRAVVWAAEMMRTLMSDWVDASPASADAQAAYAFALESSSAISGIGAPPPEALAPARSAALHTDSVDLRTYRWVTVVRLLVKEDSLAAARSLSDSLLRAMGTPSPFRAGYLANLAALTGRARLAASLLRIAAADSVHVPFRDDNGRPLPLDAGVLGTILGLRAYAALDAPHDSVLASFERADRLIERTVPKSQRAAVRRRVFATPAVLASEDLGAGRMVSRAGNDDLLLMRAAVSRGDRAAARVAGDRFSALVASYSPGTVGPDRLTAHASMLLSLGDTTAAIHELDVALDEIPRARSILLEVTPQAGIIGRALLLRAQLAARTGDHATAVRRLLQVEALWKGADAEVRTPLGALRQEIMPP